MARMPIINDCNNIFRTNRNINNLPSTLRDECWTVSFVTDIHFCLHKKLEKRLTSEICVGASPSNWSGGHWCHKLEGIIDHLKVASPDVFKFP